MVEISDSEVSCVAFIFYPPFFNVSRACVLGALRARAALIDKNGDGVIDYQEFLPVCFSMIVEILSDKVRR